jgi:serine/threonine-protein kinase
MAQVWGGRRVASSVVVLSRMGDQVGRVLSGRYRLLAPVGSGASAQVFLADDTRLRRRVAVKLLHAALSDDEAFLRRFRAEAQAAAALNHPHILAVYDWGEDDTPYLVTEYLGGGSLRSILDGGRRLDPSQALLVGLEAGRALDHAHRRGFVHRDIKPANLLFGEEGRLRIADFGLARALAEAAWTEPAGAVLGTARYASPEQARGELVTGRSDVYSLALVLVEAVTGAVPFAADTTIATLMARVERAMEVPESLGALRSIVAKAGQSDPDDRPDAGALVIGLMAAASELPRPSPLPLASATAVHAETGADAQTLLPPGPRPPGGDDFTRPVGFPSDGVGQPDAPTNGQPGAVAPADQRSRRQRRRQRKAVRRAAIAAGTKRRRRWLRVAVPLLLVALIGTAAAIAATRMRVPSHDVPSLEGLTEAQALALVDENGWEVERREGREDGSTPGDVIDQQPESGVSLEEGETVVLTISVGNTLTPVPAELVGAAVGDAQAAIEAASLVLGEVVRQFDEAVPADVVIALAEGTPAELPKGDPVGLVVSDGPAPRTVPEVAAGSTFEQARDALAAVQLGAEKKEQFSETVPAGQLIGLDPAPGDQVARDSTVDVIISKGPEIITVPDVRGKSVAEAVQILEGAGFKIAGVVGNPTKTVLATDPQAGETGRRGTSVTIVARF